MPPTRAAWRQKAGIILVVVLTGYAVAHLAWQGFRSYPDLPERDPVTIHEARIAQLIPLLPATGEVGYVTTVEIPRSSPRKRASPMWNFSPSTS